MIALAMQRPIAPTDPQTGPFPVGRTPQTGIEGVGGRESTARRGGPGLTLVSISRNADRVKHLKAQDTVSAPTSERHSQLAECFMRVRRGVEGSER